MWQVSIRQFPETPETRLWCHMNNPHAPGWVTTALMTRQISGTTALHFLQAPICSRAQLAPHYAMATPPPPVNHWNIHR